MSPAISPVAPSPTLPLSSRRPSVSFGGFGVRDALNNPSARLNFLCVELQPTDLFRPTLATKWRNCTFASHKRYHSSVENPGDRSAPQLYCIAPPCLTSSYCTRSAMRHISWVSVSCTANFSLGGIDVRRMGICQATPTRPMEPPTLREGPQAQHPRLRHPNGRRTQE